MTPVTPVKGIVMSDNDSKKRNEQQRRRNARLNKEYQTFGQHLAKLEEQFDEMSTFKNSRVNF